MKIKITELLYETRSSDERNLRKELEKALKRDKGNPEGPNVEKVLDKWMEDESTVLDADDIEFVLDDLTM